MRVTLLAVALSVMSSVLPVCAQAVMRHYHLDIARQPLDGALKDFANQTGLQVARFSDRVDGSALVGPVNGELSAEEALKSLLGPRGLSYRMVNERTVVVQKPGAESDVPATANPSSDSHPGERREGTESKSFWDRFRLAQVDSGRSGPAATLTADPGASAASPGKTQLDEIVVTAEKEEASSLTVPMSLTALSGDQLQRTQSFRFEDFVSKVPGLTLINNGALGSQLVIRGVTAGAANINGNVATYVDETPYAPEGPFAVAYISAPNIDTFDMQRIEVLRGPQGTLYGANALSGVLKYVTNRPDPSGWAATVETSASSVAHGGTGSDVHAMLNAPLGDHVAARLVAYTNYYPGFIDDPARGLEDVNGVRFSGVRGSLLFEPTSDWSIRLNAIYQERRWHDYGNEDVHQDSLIPIEGNLEQANLIGQPGTFTSRIYNATVNWNPGPVKLTSATSYYKELVSYLADYTKSYGAFFSSPQATYGAALTVHDPIESITQELRLASAGSEPLHWQVGTYFTHEHANQVTNIYLIDTAGQVLYNNPATILYNDEPVRYREYAGFANMDYYFSDRLDLGIGARYSHNNQTFHTVTVGAFGNNNVGNVSSQGVVTYSTDLRWHLSQNSIVYGRVASGFSPGGPNSVLTVPDSPNISSQYQSSSTINYEVGAKGSLLEGRLTADVSAFLIDWSKIQLVAFIGNENTIVNGGRARSDGIEWEVNYLPVRGVTLGFSGDYTHAYLTEATPTSVNGHVGDRLGGVPLWQTSLSVDYQRPIIGQVEALAGIDWRALGNRFADFEQSGMRQQMPSYSILDARVGVRNARWQLTVFAKNLLDKIALNYLKDETLGGGLGPQSATVYPPRTIGVALTATF